MNEKVASRPGWVWIGYYPGKKERHTNKVATLRRSVLGRHTSAKCGYDWR